MGLSCKTVAVQKKKRVPLSFLHPSTKFHLIISGKPLPESKEHWKRKPYTRRELNNLCAITKDMSADKVIRRIKATTYPDIPGAFIEMAGYKFKYSEEK